MHAMEASLIVSSSPHIHSGNHTRWMMLDVVIALVPALIAGVYWYGLYSLVVVALAVAAAIASEYLYQKAMKKPVLIHDFSAVVTGLLVGLNLPPAAPWWLPIVGSAIAIIVVKQIFGGLGQNFMNPAMAARVILMICWPLQMSRWVFPAGLPDAVASATPLALHSSGITPDYLQLFIGQAGGVIGETSKMCLLLGGIYLIARKVISWRIPVAYLASTALMAWIFGGTQLFTGDVLFHLLSGGLFLGAFFMATDYSTSPINVVGQLIAGVICGVITMVIRLYGANIEGVSFAVLIMNLATPLLDKATRPRIYGEVKARARIAS